ncbi:hypothetical protein [Streptomyces sp. NPDC052042]|uniref:hypothetical protein n=1 Tax=Streptomyces sp. NPDC052042 TaxID=3365683 RepID=UPI0037D7FB91
MKIIQTIAATHHLDRPAYFLIGRRPLTEPRDGDTWFIPDDETGRGALRAQRRARIASAVHDTVIVAGVLGFIGLLVFWVLLRFDPITSFAGITGEGAVFAYIGLLVVCVVLGLFSGYRLTLSLDRAEKAFSQCPGAGVVHPYGLVCDSLPAVRGRDALSLLADAAYEGVFDAALELVADQIHEDTQARIRDEQNARHAHETAVLDKLTRPRTRTRR